ncbi:hypothetical protein, partial [Vibrio harveyi]|uniref:hypothetical protein n=1 Tax=Vibrio harveyi TaxID=669 RepID=UPI001E3EE009
EKLYRNAITAFLLFKNSCQRQNAPLDCSCCEISFSAIGGSTSDARNNPANTTQRIKNTGGDWESSDPMKV